MAPQLTRPRAALALGALAVVLAGAWLLARGLAGPDSRVVTGVVDIVNAFQSKICITPDGAPDQWCGPLAVSGETIATGQQVTMVINQLNTANGHFEMGTVVPSRLGVRP